MAYGYKKRRRSFGGGGMSKTNYLLGRLINQVKKVKRNTASQRTYSKSQIEKAEKRVEYMKSRKG